jgi:hypothetical protein
MASINVRQKYCPNTNKREMRQISIIILTSYKLSRLYSVIYTVIILAFNGTGIGATLRQRIRNKNKFRNDKIGKESTVRTVLIN